MVFILIFLTASFQQTAEKKAYGEVAYTFPDGFHSSGTKISFNSKNGDLYIFRTNQNKLVRITEAGTIDTLATLTFEDDFGKKMETSVNGDKILFWDSAVGRAYSFDLESLLLDRIDTSFHHQNMFGHAAVLSEHDHIYAIGGYGFWEFKNLLIRFEPDTGQWEEVIVKNREAVIESMRGMLFNTQSDFYYLISPADNANSSPLAYRLNREKKEWQKNEVITELLNGIFFGNSAKSTKAGQTSTHKVDAGSGIFGFLSNEGQSDYINLVDYTKEKLYRIRVSALGMVDPRALFYSERLNQWIVAGHNPATNRRNTLLITTFEFDPAHPFVQTITPPKYFNSLYPYAAFIVLFFIGFIGWKVLNNNKKEIQASEEENYPVNIHISNDKPVIMINGNTFNSAGDRQLEKLWEIIIEMVQSGQNEILASTVDQQLYSSQTHQSYISRNRKKLIKLINDECGKQLITEEKSKVDKRFKVLTVDLGKIKVVR